jgi:hypothetical protein
MNYRWCLLPLAVFAAHAQNTKLPNELGFSFNGAAIALHTESSRANSPLSTSGSVVVGAFDGAHRIVLDKESKPVFAYDIELRKTAPGAVTLRIKPIDQQKVRTEDWYPKGKLTGDIPTLTGAREFPPLQIGDAVQVDILYNPGTNEKLWDVIRVVEGLEEHLQQRLKTPTGRFSFDRVKITIDGRMLYERRNSWMIGSAMKMVVPGHGEYYFLLEPTTDFPFQASGWVDHNVLRFKAAGESVEITGMSNLLQHAEFGTVWVYHVPEAKVARKAQSIDFTCADNMNQLLGRE